MKIRTLGSYQKKNKQQQYSYYTKTQQYANLKLLVVINQNFVFKKLFKEKKCNFFY